jgi:hypothetical protein
MVKNSVDIDSLEDPVTQSVMHKAKFFSIYKPMLEELNGQGGYPDSYVSFFFERSVAPSLCTASSSAHTRGISRPRPMKSTR